MSFVRYMLIIATRLRLPLPVQVRRRALQWSQDHRTAKVKNRIFSGTSLKWCDEGFWQIEPMPTDAELDVFYEDTYWSLRGDYGNLVTRRDLAHFELLVNYFPERILGRLPLTVVNFGSGHGGVSHLFKALGHQVVNVDPFPLEVERFSHVRRLRDIETGIDLFYSSHSMEHVTDIKSEVNEVSRLLKDDGVVFIEVPNAGKSCGLIGTDYEVPEIHPPHTYYFLPEFFAMFELDTVELSAYEYHGFEYGRRTLSRNGEVLRYVGKKQTKRLA